MILVPENRRCLVPLIGIGSFRGQQEMGRVAAFDAHRVAVALGPRVRHTFSLETGLMITSSEFLTRWRIMPHELAALRELQGYVLADEAGKRDLIAQRRERVLEDIRRGYEPRRAKG